MSNIHWPFSSVHSATEARGEETETALKVKIWKQKNAECQNMCSPRCPFVTNQNTHDLMNFHVVIFWRHVEVRVRVPR